MRWKIKKSIIVMIFVGMMISGCNQKQDFSSVEDNQTTNESSEIVSGKNNEVENEMNEDTQRENPSEKDNVISVYYDILRRNHEILIENICKNPSSIYEDPWLKEQLADEIKDAERAERFSENPSYPNIDYFLFDFNNDGEDEYLICWSGRVVDIYQKTEEGNLKRIFSVLLSRLKDHEGEYYPIAILNEITDGYYSFVLPPAYNEIWKYDKEIEGYETVYVPIAYDILRESHVILNENICKNPHSVYDDPWLKEQLADEIKDAERYEQFSEYPSQPQIDYFLFDFNDDGEDEYLICWSGAGWTGTAGNGVDIYQKTEAGNLNKIYTVVARLNNYAGGYYPIAVLNEKTDGYYAFVLPSDYNSIWKYNRETGQYDFAGNSIIEP